MPSLAWQAEEQVPVARALAIGRAAHGRVSAATPVIVYAASLAGDARVLGAYQREEDALADDVRARLPVLRRATGGPACAAGAGTLYLALALANASVLVECPRDRVLNRNVRPILAALRRVGALAYYFGREFVSVEHRPAALVAWAREPRGAVLLECVLGVDRTFALPDRELGLRPSAPRMLGKAPIALAELGLRPTAPALAREVARACAETRPFDRAERALEPLEIEPPPVRARAWSAPREVPIGFVRAGLTLDERRVIEDAVLAGDFYQDADAPSRLRSALAGGPATPERIRAAIDATYGPHGAVIEGLRSCEPVLEAFLEVAGVEE